MGVNHPRQRERERERERKKEREREREHKDKSETAKAGLTQKTPRASVLARIAFTEEEHKVFFQRQEPSLLEKPRVMTHQRPQFGALAYRDRDLDRGTVIMRTRRPFLARVWSLSSQSAEE